MYSALFSIVRSYWRDNGGFSAWVSSPFFHASFIFSLLYLAGVISIDWREIAKSSLPTILGFSLAAYTITFTLMGSALHRALSVAIDKKSGISLIRIVNATFFHVILFQAIALLYSLTSNGDFLLFRKTIEKVSPPLLLITTSSFLAILRTSARRCLASEYV